MSLPGRLEVRRLNGHAEFAGAVDLQRAVWRFEDLELLPVRFFVVAEKVGGQVLGAFMDGTLAGFCLAIPGVRDGGVYLHSHMLGVLAEFRNAGVGSALKMAQRDDALARGFGLIEWTFDPLELKNAHFNIERLGAVVAKYVPNQYGFTTSPLHGGLPTDRCTAQWWLRRDRAKGPIEGRIAVPADIEEIKRSDPERAREIQCGVAAGFADMLSKGYAAIGFERSSSAGVYLFGPWASE